MTIKIIQFEPYHLLGLEAEEPEKKNFDSIDCKISYGRGLLAMAEYLDDGTQNCFSAFNDDKIVCCYGAMMVENSVCTTWMLWSKEFKYHYKDIIPHMKQCLSSTKCRRVQGLCSVNNEKSNRFHLMLGYKLETSLKCYMDNGEDANVYSIIKYANV